MNDISDSELLMLTHENIEEASEILNNKYTSLIKLLINKNITLIKGLNININELYNYCLEIYQEALNTFDEYKNASFNTYVSILINRAIKKEILKNLRKKKRLNEVSLNELIDNNQNIEYKINSYAKDPLDKLCEEETIKRIKLIVMSKLNLIEFKIFLLLEQGFECKSISKLLRKDYYYTYRKIQRIRKKIISEF